MKFLKYSIFLIFGIFLISNASAMVLDGIWQNGAHSMAITSGNNASFTIDFGSEHSPSSINAQLYNSNDVSVWQKNYNNLVNSNTITDTISQSYLSVGSYQLILNGNDAANFQDSATLYLTVNPNTNPTNSSPIISSIPNQIINENTSYSYQVNASDPDGDKIYYSLSAPSW